MYDQWAQQVDDGIMVFDMVDHPLLLEKLKLFGLDEEVIQSPVKQITSHINGLCMLSSRSSFQTRLMVANGIVISKLCYLIQLWGGCDGYLLKPLQVLKNRAARSVTGWGWFTPNNETSEEMQLAEYQAACLLPVCDLGSQDCYNQLTVLPGSKDEHNPPKEDQTSNLRVHHIWRTILI